MASYRPQQYFQPSFITKDKWKFYSFTVTPKDRTIKVPPRKVPVLCHIPDAAILGVGAQDDENVVKDVVADYEMWFQQSVVGQTIPLEERVAFYSTLANNMQAGSGVSMLDALSRGLATVKSPYFRGVVAAVMYYIRNVDGSLSDAISFFPAAFDDMTVSLVSAGEQAGNLREVLIELSKNTRGALKTWKKIAGILAYPVLVFGAIFVVLNVLGIFVFPKLMPTFVAMMPHGLPTSTKIVNAVTVVMHEYWYMMPVLVVLSIFLFKRRAKLLNEPHFQRILIRVPGFGKLIRLAIIIRTLRVFSQMLRAKVPPARLYDIVARCSGNIVYSEYFRAVYVRLNSGLEPFHAFSRERYRIGEPGLDLAQAMRTGSATNDPASAIDELVEIYDAEMSSQLERLPNYFNLLTLMVVAPIFMLLALAVIEPSFKMG